MRGETLPPLRLDRTTIAQALDSARRAVVHSSANLVRAPLFIDTVLILGSVAIMTSGIALLGALGYGTGFDVFPIGEDNNWVDILQRGEGTNAARLSWAIDSRNPLSPWWYIAARPIILRFEAGLLALRYGMAAVLALSSYCMVVTVAGRQSRLFALGLGILVTFWMSNRFTDQIIWNFQGALAASLISVAAYAEFLRNERRSYLLYAVSIISWFIAFASYTIQCGAVLAIGYLALRRTSNQHPRDRSWIFHQVRVAIADTTPYFVLLGLFLLLWQTTINQAVADALAGSLHFSPTALVNSLREGVSGDFAISYGRVMDSPDIIAFICTAAGFSALTFISLLWRRRRSEIQPTVIAVPNLIDFCLVLVCIASPTIALESSSSIWSPGTRWPMIYQVTTPALLLAVATIILVTVIPRASLRYKLWSAGVSVAVGIGGLFALAHNQLQVEITRNEKFVRDSLVRMISEDLAAGHRPPLQVLLMLDPVSRSRWRSLDVLSQVIARVWLRREDISFRLIPWGPPQDSRFASWWPIRFGSDLDGVGNAKQWRGSLPYENVRILAVTGRTARRISTADRDDFKGWEVKWRRDQPIVLPGVDATAFCPLAWSADQDALLVGWSIGERDQHGPMRWTTSHAARLTLPSDCRDRSALRVTVAYALSTRNIEELALFVNGQKLRYDRRSVDGNFVYEAQVPQDALSARRVLDVELVVNSLDIIPGAERQFGVAVRRVEIAPLDTSQSLVTQHRPRGHSVDDFKDNKGLGEDK